MKTVTLNCWENFRCVAERCRHSCCVGWEIGVDEESLAHLSLPLEQLPVGFLYRHLSGAEDSGGLRGRVAFSMLSFRVLYALAAAGEGSVEELCELARLYSGEIEYSDENLPALLALCAT